MQSLKIIVYPSLTGNVDDNALPVERRNIKIQICYTFPTSISPPIHIPSDPASCCQLLPVSTAL